jgi:topoisomerase-4 subunit A
LQKAERQVNAILDTRLRHLAKLEEGLLKAEQDALLAEEAQLLNWLGDDLALRALVKSEIAEDVIKLIN